MKDLFQLSGSIPGAALMTEADIEAYHMQVDILREYYRMPPRKETIS